MLDGSRPGRGSVSRVALTGSSRKKDVAVQNAASSIIFLVLLIGIFYFMLIRPQKRRVEQHRALMDSLQIGDDVITIGGIHGTIRALRDDELEVEVAPGTTLRLLRSAVARRITEDVEEPTEPPEE
jgi:preprotein translocase subunit YajC